MIMISTKQDMELLRKLEEIQWAENHVDWEFS